MIVNVNGECGRIALSSFRCCTLFVHAVKRAFDFTFGFSIFWRIHQTNDQKQNYILSAANGHWCEPNMCVPVCVPATHFSVQLIPLVYWARGTIPKCILFGRNTNEYMPKITIGRPIFEHRNCFNGKIIAYLINRISASLIVSEWMLLVNIVALLRSAFSPGRRSGSQADDGYGVCWCWHVVVLNFVANMNLWWRWRQHIDSKSSIHTHTQHTRMICCLCCATIRLLNRNEGKSKRAYEFP